MSKNIFPKLHNAMWPGLVGKGSPGAEPFHRPRYDAATSPPRRRSTGVKFDGVDLFLFEPHVSIDSSDDDLKKLADKIRAKGFVVGSVVAPVWPPTGGGSAMGSEEDRKKFVEAVRKACRIAGKLRELEGAALWRSSRIDSAAGVTDWEKDPKGNTKRIAQTFNEAAKVAKDHGEKLAAEGEICWGGMHSWKYMIQTLEAVGQPKVVGFQADMAHTLLYTLGYNAPEHRIVPKDFHWEPGAFHEAMKKMTKALRPWTFDFHVAQNDATVKGSGTARQNRDAMASCSTDPNGKLNIARDAGYWMRDDKGKVTKKIKHICWDGCMFPERDDDEARKRGTTFWPR